MIHINLQTFKDIAQSRTKKMDQMGIVSINKPVVSNVIKNKVVSLESKKRVLKQKIMSTVPLLDYREHSLLKMMLTTIFYFIQECLYLVHINFIHLLVTFPTVILKI